jgi:hypothetical protein
LEEEDSTLFKKKYDLSASSSSDDSINDRFLERRKKFQKELKEIKDMVMSSDDE